MGMIARLVACIGAVAALVSCEALPSPVQVTRVQQQSPAEISPEAELEPVKLSKVVYNIPRGTRIGTYQTEGKVLVGPCRAYIKEIYWNQGRVTMRSLEFSDIFFEELSNAGYPVVGDPKEMFGEAVQRRRAMYAVGAQVTEIKMHICDHVSYWNAFPTGKQSGEVSVAVNWQVYSELQREVVFETMTLGYARMPSEFGGGIPDGEVYLLRQAFGVAAANLAADEEFRDTLAQTEQAVVQTAGYAPITISKLRSFRRPVAQNIDDIVNASVTLSLGNAHGSGFVVSKDGLILTNYHVVGEGKRVLVEFATGLKVDGEVLRSHKQRDVALVRANIRGVRVLPIRTRPAEIGEEVFAVGTPLTRELRATLTKGIVSAVRRQKRTGLELIQSDVDIQAGNSGGPLVDDKGNVVGIAVSGIGRGGTSVGLNFFVPIHDALEKLNMRVVKR